MLKNNCHFPVIKESIWIYWFSLHWDYDPQSLKINDKKCIECTAVMWSEFKGFLCYIDFLKHCFHFFDDVTIIRDKCKETSFSQLQYVPLRFSHLVSIHFCKHFGITKCFEKLVCNCQYESNVIVYFHKSGYGNLQK